MAQSSHLLASLQCLAELRIHCSGTFGKAGHVHGEQRQSDQRMKPLELRRRFLALTSSAIIASGVRVSLAETPSSDDELTDLSAAAAAKAIRQGELKAEAYAAALLARAERWKSLNAFRTLHPESVLEAARAADKKRAAGAALGALHGVPIPVKDSVNTQALPTSNGTRALRDFRPHRDADVLIPLFRAGGILMGKTNLHELSCGWSSNNDTFGAVLNPYDTLRTPGGSSGGSAAAVASRMAPLAIAEDTYGSIRIPATFCGLAGLRCTYGRYPGGGMMPLGKNKFDQVGPLARSVDDLVLFDSVVTGARDRVIPRSLKGVRIGVSPDFLAAGIDPETETIVSRALERVQDAGATLVHAELPENLRRASDVVRTILGYELLASFATFLKDYDTGVSLDQLISEAGPSLVPLLEASKHPGTAAEYARLLRQMEEIRKATVDHYHQHRIEVIAFAPALMPAFPQGNAQQVQINGRAVDLFTAIGRQVGLGSCASLACLVLPAGTTRSGLPVGVEFDGLPGTDRQMLSLGLTLEQTLGRVPPPAIGVTL
jgi:indoleacetamide hydrolase